jgi:hypothetical protein
MTKEEALHIVSILQMPLSSAQLALYKKAMQVLSGGALKPPNQG